MHKTACKKHRHLGITLALLLAILLPCLNAAPAPQNPEMAKSLPGDTFKHFWNVAETLHRAQSQSFRQIAVGDLVEAGLKAMVNKIDAHSSFFTPKSYQTTLDLASGQFPGVGVSIISKAVDEDTLLIVDVISAGPADVAGIKGGDKVVEIDGVKLRGLTSDEVVSRLKGKVDSTVTIKVTRDKKPLEFVVTRKIIKDRSVLSYYFTDQQAAYIAVKTFSEKTAPQINTLLKKAYGKNCRAILLDLRKNPGGLLEAAIKTSSLFLPDHSLVATTKNNKGAVMQSYHTSGRPIHDKKIPLFILTDNFTASSSEILTGCLQHYAHQHNALHVFVVGMPTFGKGSVQEIMPLSYGCALKLTTMLYYLPGGNCLQAQGITPDITIKPRIIPHDQLKWVEELYGKEAALPHHITREEVEGKPRPPALAAKKQPEKKEKSQLSPSEIEEQFQESLANDHTVQTCLTLANAYNLAHQLTPEKVAKHRDALAFLQRQVVTSPPAVSRL